MSEAERRNIELLIFPTEKAIEVLQQDPKSTNATVAICSADWEASPEGMRFADMFITKLVAVDELLGVIKSLLRKDRFATAA